MPQKAVESWTRGNTLKLSYAAKVLNVKQSNMHRLFADGRLRKIKVPFEKFERIPIIDVLLLIAKEHSILSIRKQQIEQYTNHLGESYTFHENKKHNKHCQNITVPNDTLEIVRELKMNSDSKEFDELMIMEVNNG